MNLKFAFSNISCSFLSPNYSNLLNKRAPPNKRAGSDLKKKNLNRADPNKQAVSRVGFLFKSGKGADPNNQADMQSYTLWGHSITTLTR